MKKDTTERSVPVAPEKVNVQKRHPDGLEMVTRKKSLANAAILKPNMQVKFLCFTLMEI